jgi:hypothetical protein
MMLTCTNCGRQHPLTDDEVAQFHPRFFCLRSSWSSRSPKRSPRAASFERSVAMAYRRPLEAAPLSEFRKVAGAMDPRATVSPEPDPTFHGDGLPADYSAGLGVQIGLAIVAGAGSNS